MKLQFFYGLSEVALIVCVMVHAEGFACLKFHGLKVMKKGIIAEYKKKHKNKAETVQYIFHIYLFIFLQFIERQKGV